jgi:hypothetical protein
MSRIACGVINANYDRGIVSSINTLGSTSRRVPEITQINVGTPSAPDYVDLSGDPRVLGYTHIQNSGTDNCVMVAAYTYKKDDPGYPGEARIALFKINASTGVWEQLVQKTHTDWGFSNPYGLVAVNSKLHVQDYDSGKITVINLASGYTTTTLYTMPSVTDSGTTYLPHGNGMDYTPDYGLIAIYSFLPSGSYNNYYNSKLAIVPIDGSTPSIVSDLNKNVVAVTVDPDPEANYYAYICSIGGAQQGGGNPDSKIQTVDLSVPELLTAEITVSDLPAPLSPEIKRGDFVDVGFWDSSAYVLRANYDTNYTQYSYQILKTTGAQLQAGSFGTVGTDYTQTGIKTATPADATWMLGPSVDALWFVSGSDVNTVASGSLSSGSVTKKADASNESSSSFGLGDTVSGVDIDAHLNTASVVIDVADTAPALKGATARPAASRTKVAFRFIRPEELEKKAKAEVAAAKQK